MAEFRYRLVAPHKWHCLAKLTLYVHIVIFLMDSQIKDRPYESPIVPEGL